MYEEFAVKIIGILKTSVGSHKVISSEILNDIK